MNFFYILLKNSILLILRLFSIINRVIPKKDQILFFTNLKDFNDNNKALLLQLSKAGYTDKYKIIYCSKDGNKYNPVKNITYCSTFLAPFYFLRSKYCFYDAGTIKIQPSKNQKVISLWHGVPLKKIGEFLNEKSSFLDKYNDFNKILVPHQSLSNIYIKAFGCNSDQILINGFPRNDFLFSPSQESLKILDIKLMYKKHILWMPTFRESIGGRYNDSDKSIDNWDLPIFSNNSELEKLDQFLLQKDILLIMKLHPLSVFNKIKQNLNFKNIKLVSNEDINEKNIINYEFISNFDCLITDYSSVFFDYLLIDKPIAFTMEDFSSYKKNRGFTVNNPEDYLVGDKIVNIESFYNFIEKMSQSKDTYAEKRNWLKKQIHVYPDNKSTERLINFLKL